MAKNKKLEVKGTEIAILQHETDDYISLTDLARYKDSEHTDAIKENLIPVTLSKAQVSFVYANEADVLNMALFGKTA